MFLNQVNSPFTKSLLSSPGIGRLNNYGCLSELFSVTTGWLLCFEQVLIYCYRSKRFFKAWFGIGWYCKWIELLTKCSECLSCFLRSHPSHAEPSRLL